jgi:polyhydroxyalkanoate synthase
MNGFGWPEWSAWLKSKSGVLATVPQMGAPQAGYPTLGDAPGTYVFQQ